MREDYPERSPGRGMRRDEVRPPPRGNDDSRDERDDVHRSRHDYSRSPLRHDHHISSVNKEFSDGESDRMRDGRFAGRRGRGDNPSPRRFDDGRRSRYDSWHDDHRRGMYDDEGRDGRRSRDRRGLEPHDRNALDRRVNREDGPDHRIKYEDGPEHRIKYEDGPDHRIKYEDGQDHRIKYEDDADYHIRPEDDKDEHSRWRYRDRRSRSRSKPRLGAAGRPNRTVVIEGFPLGISENLVYDILLEDSTMREACVDLRLVPHRGVCRAFVEFTTCGRAIGFLKQRFPNFRVRLPSPAGDGAALECELSLSFFRGWRRPEAPNGPPSSDWLCPQCGFNNFALRDECKQCGCAATAMSTVAPPMPPATPGSLGRTGAADIGRDVDQKVQILVVFPLPREMDEAMFATEMKRLELVRVEKPKEGAPKLRSTAPSVDGAGYGARQGSLHRVFLMRDADTHASLRYGFVEFWTLADALAALKKVQMTRSFEIDGTPVTVASIHLGVFVPEEREVTSEIEATSFAPLLNPSLRVRYRDLQVYPSIKMVASKPPEEDEGAKTAQDDGKGDVQKQKKRKADDSIAEAPPKKAPVMAAQMAAWKRKHNDIRGDDASAQKDTGAEQPAPIRFSLSGNKPAASAGNTGAAGAELQGQEAAPDLKDPAFYIDRERLMCLICMMRYKSSDDVDTHQKSRNHSNAMQDQAKVDAAVARISARQQVVAKQRDTSPKYRDRAKERRVAHNQPGKPTGQAVKPELQQKEQPSTSASAKTNDGGKAVADSKGAGMLAKMGWTAGASLGAHGDGLTQAISANIYKNGVGLGAEGGKLGEASEVAEARTTNSYASYVKATKEKARERYNQLG